MSGTVPTSPGIAFDSAAASYDRSFEANPVTRETRTVVWDILQEYFRPGDRVLDLNCGTGTDAVMLASRGINVTSIDSSARMIDEASRKAREKTLGHLVTTRLLALEDIGSLSGEGPFDGALSDFGGLNCVGDLRAVLAGLAGILKPGAPFIACIMNRTPLWEMAAFLSRLRWRKAFRRFAVGGTMAPVGTGSVHVWYYSPRQFSQLMEPWFRPERIEGLNILSPPPGSSGFARRHPGLTARLLKLDASLRGKYPWYALGDHFIVCARRINANLSGIDA